MTITTYKWSIEEWHELVESGCNRSLPPQKKAIAKINREQVRQVFFF